MKTCSHCKVEQPLAAFNNQATGEFGKRNECRECVKRYGRSPHGLAIGIYADQKEKCVARGYMQPAYTVEDLESWLIAQPLFDSLYATWVQSEFDTNQRPSVDRLNDYVSYTLDNIQLLTREANNQKNYDSRMDGTNNKQSLAVDMLDLNGKFIERFYSVSEAARRFNGVPSNIIGVIQKRQTRRKMPDGSYRIKRAATAAYGHRWRYSTVPNDNREITY